jgi:hypothetical protein
MDRQASNFRTRGYPLSGSYGLLFWEPGVAVFVFAERFLVAVVAGWGYSVVRVLVRWDHRCRGEVARVWRSGRPCEAAFSPWGSVGSSQQCAQATSLLRLPHLSIDLGPREVATERRMADRVVDGEPPQRLARCPPTHQLAVRNQPTKTTIPLHTGYSSPLFNAPANAPKAGAAST